MGAQVTSTKTSATASAQLPKAIFGLEVKNHQLLHEAERSYLAAQRQGGAQTLTRGLVRGGGKKPWRQKGTGRARAGSTRSPLWRSGGVTFGPTGKENYRINLPIKAKRQALKQALSLKAQAGQVQVITEPAASEGKTKPLATWLAKLKLGGTALLVSASASADLKRAARNLPSLIVTDAAKLHTYAVLTCDNLLLTQTAVTELEKRLTAKPKTRKTTATGVRT